MKGKSIDKKLATPVVFIDESQQLTNTILINKMQDKNSSIKESSNIFVGGFKYRPQSKINDNKSKINENISKMNDNKSNISKINDNKINKNTVYDEFGIINDSIGKKKYRDDNDNNNRQIVRQNEIKNISNNPWKKQNIIKNNYIDDNIYQISKNKQRQQNAIHIKSSLQIINLQNIQAKLQAHRQSLKPIEQQYNILKGRSNIQSEIKQKLRFNVDIDKQYSKIQPTKIYELIKDSQQKMQRPRQQLLIQQLWQEKKKNDPKIAQYDFKYQQFLIQKQAKKMIGSVVKDSLFTWDKYAMKQDLQKRKVAKQHKSKQKNYGQAVQSKIINKSNNKSLLTKQQMHSQQKIQIINNDSIEQRIASKDDKFIGKYMMAQIDIDKKGMISKDELADYIITKEHIIKGYHIDLKWLHTDLDNFKTKRKGMLNQNQLIQFLATLNAVHHPEMIIKQISKQDKGNNILFQQRRDNNKLYISYYNENSSKFEKIFEMLDINDDKIIKRQQFIEYILIDAECNKILDKNVIIFNIINKSITFRQIIIFILEDYRRQKNEKLKKSKQYITLQRFNQYFQIPQNLDLNKLDRDNRQKLKKDKQSYQIQIYDINEQYLSILKDIFDTIPRIYQNYIIINDFINIAIKDPQILAINDQICRIQSIQTKLPVETILSTLNRMKIQCDQYGTWDIIKNYLSRRGRPLDWNYQLIKKKKQIRAQKFKSSTLQIKKNNSLIPGELAITKGIFQLSSKKKNQKNNSIEKYTIPQPFNITDEIKKKNTIKQLSSQQIQIQELKKKFKAKPVNADILEPKPQLVQGKLGKSQQKINSYNYENYQNDRIQRVLKKAQQQFQQQQRLKQIKRLTQIKAKQVKVDLNKKLQDVVKQQKRNKQKTKPKPTKPYANPNLYPQNPKQQAKKKLQKYKQKLEKEEQAAQIREGLKKQIQQKAKQRNQQIKQTAKQKKKRQQQQKAEMAKLTQNTYKPKINKRDTTEQQKQALKKAREERQRKKIEEQEAIAEILEKKKKEKLSYIKQQNYLDISQLQDQQILAKLDQVDLQELLLDEHDKSEFRKQFQLKNKTRKEIKQKFNGQAGRQRAAMQAQQKRLAEQKKQMKQKKQSKVIKQKIEQAKQLKNEVTTTLNVDTNFHRSNALRRYRAIMEGKQANDEYDQYSRVGDPEPENI